MKSWPSSFCVRAARAVQGLCDQGNGSRRASTAANLSPPGLTGRSWRTYRSTAIDACCRNARTWSAFARAHLVTSHRGGDQGQQHEAGPPRSSRSRARTVIHLAPLLGSLSGIVGGRRCLGGVLGRGIVVVGRVALDLDPILRLHGFTLSFPSPSLPASVAQRRALDTGSHWAERGYAVGVLDWVARRIGGHGCAAFCRMEAHTMIRQQRSRS